jgi:hypothetical protein
MAFLELINSDSAPSPGGGVASVTLDTTGADLLFVHMSGWFGAPTLSDSEGITGWAGPGSNDSVSNTCRFKFGGATSATHTFTATGGNWPSISVLVFRGGVSGDTANQQNAATSGVATLTVGPTSPNPPAGNNHLVISTLAKNNDSVPTVGGTNVTLAIAERSGWIINQAMDSIIAWGVQSSAAVVTAQWDWTGNSSCAASIITFVPGDEIVVDPIVGSMVAGVNTTVRATRAIAFGLDGNTNIHDEAGKFKVFGDMEVTGTTQFTGGTLGIVGSQSPGSMTIATDQYGLHGKRLTLTGAQRLTLEGTAGLVING